MSWTLHLVGEEDPSTLLKVMESLVSTIEEAGHVLRSATLGTDAGSIGLPVTGPVPEELPPVQSSVEHVVTDDPDNPLVIGQINGVPTDTPPSI